MKKLLNAVHQVIYALGDENLFGYFGWPTVTRLRSGELVVGASGFRNAHVCPWGKVVLFTSTNEGADWSLPEIIHDSAIDDRDAGVLELADGRLLLSWFTSDTRFYFPDRNEARPNNIKFRPVLDSWSEETMARDLGSFIKIRELDGSWGERLPVPVSTPHGPVQLRNGTLLYLGRVFGHDTPEGLRFSMPDMLDGQLKAFSSDDFGKTWHGAGTLPGDKSFRFSEPHVLELKSGRLLALIRGEKDYFGCWQSISDDGGCTWSEPYPVCEGAPPHLMQHSSGTIIASCGYRKPGFGQRVMFSHDEGITWDTDWIIRDDGNNLDLGYPSTVELTDGSLYTVYYQALPGRFNCALQASRWRLP